MRVVPDLMLSRELPIAELSAVRLDGEAFPLGDGWLLLDQPDTPLARARALGEIAPPRFITELQSAAWVYGARAYPPARHRFCSRAEARRHPHHDTRWELREVVIDPRELTVLGPLTLSSRLRTAVELARCEAEFSSTDEESVRELARLGGFTLAECLELDADRKNLPYRARARARLSRALDPARARG